MTALALLELTARPAAGELRGRRMLVALPFDHVEQRDGHSYVRTAGGADLYVTETIDQIVARLSGSG